MSHRAEAIYSQTGGCHVGRNFWWAFNATWPFAGLFIYRDELVLSSFLRRYCFARSDITEITRYGVPFSPGIRIHHTVANYPKFVVFWSWNLPDLEQYDNAFPVTTPTV